jgi:hypothetical protein
MSLQWVFSKSHEIFTYNIMFFAASLVTYLVFLQKVWFKFCAKIFHNTVIRHF